MESISNASVLLQLVSEPQDSVPEGFAEVVVETLRQLGAFQAL